MLSKMVKILFKPKTLGTYFPYLLFFITVYMLWNLCQFYHGMYYDSRIRPKYILTWNKECYLNELYKELPYSKLKCKFNNCILTNNKYFFLGDFRQFDAIAFMENDLNVPLKVLREPGRRTTSQIYIFFTIESAASKPACEIYNDNFFNWTYTSRLNSNIIWYYFIVQNKTGHMVAPSAHVDWQVNKNPISPKIKNILQHRTKAVAWLVSNCIADSFRHDYVTKLQESLFHFSLKIDVYGKCSGIKCLYGDCEKMLSKDYYFYLAFENSFADDYVTEKVLHGYDNYVVPIVFGGANYDSFLPPGSYINARNYHPYHLAFLIKETMSDQSKYEEYFSWTNSYTIIDKTPELNPICNLCEALNSEKAKYTPAYKNFRQWWNTPAGMKWCLPQEYWNNTSAINIDAKHIFKLY